jgi:hypothetical protein
MDRNSRPGLQDKVLKPVCVGGIFIIYKRIGYDRRHKIHKCRKEYERRLSNWAQNFKRRRQSIDIVV